MVQLEPEQIERLDRVAARQSVSRSQVIRDAVREALTPAPDPHIEALYAAAYSDDRLDDEWGDLEAWHDAAEQDRSADDRDPW